jgi:hypothetical protein
VRSVGIFWYWHGKNLLSCRFFCAGVAHPGCHYPLSFPPCQLYSMHHAWSRQALLWSQCGSQAFIQRATFLPFLNLAHWHSKADVGTSDEADIDVPCHCNANSSQPKWMNAIVTYSGSLGGILERSFLYAEISLIRSQAFPIGIHDPCIRPSVHS